MQRCASLATDPRIQRRVIARSVERIDGQLRGLYAVAAGRYHSHGRWIASTMHNWHDNWNDDWGDHGHMGW